METLFQPEMQLNHFLVSAATAKSHFFLKSTKSTSMFTLSDKKIIYCCSKQKWDFKVSLSENYSASIRLFFRKISLVSKIFAFFSAKNAAVTKKVIDLERIYFVHTYSTKICIYHSPILDEKKVLKIEKKRLFEKKKFDHPNATGFWRISALKQPQWSWEALISRGTSVNLLYGCTFSLSCTAILYKIDDLCSIFTLATAVVREMPNATPLKPPCYRLWAALSTKSNRMVEKSIASSMKWCHSHNHECNVKRTIPIWKVWSQKSHKILDWTGYQSRFSEMIDAFCISYEA